MQFLVDAGRWEGCGEVRLPFGEQSLPFRTEWEYQGDRWIQRVFLDQVETPIENAYELSMHVAQPTLILESAALGRAHGRLVMSAGKIGWELEGAEVTGYEYFTLQPDGSYQHCAEFVNPQGMRTIIQGKLWCVE